MIDSPEVLYRKLEAVKIGGTTCLYTLEKCQQLYPYVERIQQLKTQTNTIVLAHSYVSPELQLIADFTGDSFELSKWAKTTQADRIVFVAVRFMAETAKLLNPSKEVLVPSFQDGCTLADSITGPQVDALRKQYPHATFVCYINTSVAVKARCDVCVTSSNVMQIIEALPTTEIVFLPDRLMAQNIRVHCQQHGIQKQIHEWDGVCYVHDEYDPAMIDYIRQQYPNVQVAVHPECAPAVVALADFVGSTSQMMAFVAQTDAPYYFLLTECGLATRLQVAHPDKVFVGTCTMCRYMKSNRLADVERVMCQPTERDRVLLDPADIEPAQRCLDAMFTWASIPQKGGVI